MWGKVLYFSKAFPWISVFQGQALERFSTDLSTFKRQGQALEIICGSDFLPADELYCARHLLRYEHYEDV